MGYLGKVLIGGSLGVLAVAAVPFTGGGSLFGAATIASSLAGAGGIAGAVGVAGGGVGALVQGVEDKQKEKIVKTAKEYAFQDGMNEGVAKTAQEIKKLVDFYLATTALSFYIARADGEIDEAEMLEIQFDLDAIKKNKDISEAIAQKLGEIAVNENLAFEDVKLYLNNVGMNTLKELEKDIDEIIMANGEIAVEELEAKDHFIMYLREREREERADV